MPLLRLRPHFELRWAGLLTAVLAVGPFVRPAGATEVLVNGNLDAAPIGTGWLQDDGGSGYPPIVSMFELPPGVVPHSVPNIAWLGGLHGVTLGITQPVSVPAGAGGLRLTGQLLIATEELGGVYDVMSARLLTAGGALLETFKQWSNQDANGAWSAFAYDAAGNYAGQSVQVQFVSTNDATYNTNFFLDTISLDAMATVDVAAAIGPALHLWATGPNPTRGVARLRLDLPAHTWVRASVRDLAGRVVVDLTDGMRDAGTHDLSWSCANADGNRVAPGVYFFVVTAGDRTLSRRFSVLH